VPLRTKSAAGASGTDEVSLHLNLREALCHFPLSSGIVLALQYPTRRLRGIQRCQNLLGVQLLSRRVVIK